MIFLAPLAAWNTPFDEATHAVNSFEIFNMSFSESRQDLISIATFRAERKNPGVLGLSATPGSYWVLSERRTDDPTAVEIARGRLTGLPTQLAGDTCELEFICLPPDDEEVLKTAADALRIGEVDYDPTAVESVREAAEQYDPLFFNADSSDDPLNVMLARRNLWRWNPKTLVPEIISLDEGANEYTINDVLDGSLNLSVSTPPKSISKLRITADWTQEAKGVAHQWYKEVTTYTYQDFLQNFPKPGDPIGNNTGWSFEYFYAQEISAGSTACLQATSSNFGNAQNSWLKIRSKYIRVGWGTAFDYKQQREEVLTISAPAATQPVLGDDQSEIVETLFLGSLDTDNTTPEWRYEDENLDPIIYEVGDTVQAFGKVYECILEHTAESSFSTFIMQTSPTPVWEDATASFITEVAVPTWQLTVKKAPVSDMRTPQYFTIDRGKRSLAYGIRYLDRIICERSMAAVVSFECPMNLARDINTGDAVRLPNAKIIGGEVVGIVSSIELNINGSSRTASIQLLCGLGDGEDPAVAGVDQYTSGGVVYEVNADQLSVPVNAYGLHNSVPKVDKTYNQANWQTSVASSASNQGEDPIAAISALPTQWHLKMPDIAEEDLLTRRIDVTCEPIVVPRGITVSP